MSIEEVGRVRHMIGPQKLGRYVGFKSLLLSSLKTRAQEIQLVFACESCVD